jgi:hypothetical protein
VRLTPTEGPPLSARPPADASQPVPLTLDESTATSGAFAPGRRAHLAVFPGDPRYRSAAAEVVLPPLGETLVVSLPSAPELTLACTLPASTPSVMVVLRALPSERLLAQRLGVGLASPPDAEGQELLLGTGEVGPPDAEGARVVRLVLGVDLDLPAVVRVEVIPPEGSPRTLEVSLADPRTLARVDLR